MTTVYLHGELAEVMGRSVWQFEINSLVEIFRALEANTGKLLSYLTQNLETEFRMVVDKSDTIHMDEIGMRRAPEVVHVMPVASGASKSGGWLLLIGIAIIAIVLTAGTATAGAAGYTAFTTAGTTLGTLGTLGLTLGATLALSGLSQLIASNKSKSTERPENTPSYIFNGAINTYRQGNPIAIGFGGPLSVGSQVISVSLHNVAISQTYLP